MDNQQKLKKWLEVIDFSNKKVIINDIEGNLFCRI